MAPDRETRDLLHDWQRQISDILSALAGAGHVELPRQLADPMHRQLDLLRGIVEREQRLQQDLAQQIVAPVDAVFDLLQDSAGTLRRQGEALQAAARALEETAGLMRLQAEHFEQTIEAARKPVDLARAAAGIPRARSEG